MLNFYESFFYINIYIYKTDKDRCRTTVWMMYLIRRLTLTTPLLDATRRLTDSSEDGLTVKLTACKFDELSMKLATDWVDEAWQVAARGTGRLGMARQGHPNCNQRPWILWTWFDHEVRDTDVNTVFAVLINTTDGRRLPVVTAVSSIEIYSGFDIE